MYAGETDLGWARINRRASLELKLRLKPLAP